MSEQKLMLVVTSLSLAGGAEVQAIDMGLGLKERGWDVEIASLLTPEQPALELIGGRLRVHDLGMRRGMPDPAALLRFRAILRESRPDVVHSHMTHANLLARLVRPFAKIPVLINTLHGYKMYSVKSTSAGGRELAHRLTDGFTDLTTVVCQAAADRYARIHVAPAHKLMVMPNGIRTSTYRPDETLRTIERRNLNLRDELAWLAVGRLEIVKDYTTLLRAFARAIEAEERQVLLIAGAGSLRQNLAQTAEDLGIGPKVRFLGFRADVPSLMRAADAYAMSSIFEGMPLALLEAGASELPVVATRVGGNAETMIEGRTGLLVPARNYLELGRAMLRVTGMSPQERRSMGRAGGEFVRRNYCLDVILDRWEVLYAQLLGQPVRCLAKEAV